MLKLNTTITVSERTKEQIISAAMQYFFASTPTNSHLRAYDLLKSKSSDINPERFVICEFFSHMSFGQIVDEVDSFIHTMTLVAHSALREAEVSHG